MAMAIVFADSIDHYTTLAQAVLKGWGSDGSPILPTAGQGRHSSAAMYVAASGAYGRGIYFTLPTADQDIGVAAALNISGVGVVSPGSSLFRILDAATVQVDLRIDDGKHLIVTRNGTVLGTSANAFPSLPAMHHIEVLAHIANSPDGWAAVYVDGVEWLLVTGVDTQASGNATANKVNFTGFPGDPAFYLEDVVIQSGSGASVPGSLLGDCGVYALAPDAAGNYNSQFSRVGAGVDSDYKAVDEATPDDDTTYIASATVGHKSSWSYPAPAPTSGNIQGIQLVIDMRKDDAGSRNVRPFVRIGGADYTGTTVSITDTYSMVRQLWLLNPATTEAWTLPDFPLEMGIEVIA